jgi:hypothetical protein
VREQEAQVLQVVGVQEDLVAAALEQRLEVLLDQPRLSAAPARVT